MVLESVIDRGHLRITDVSGGVVPRNEISHMIAKTVAGYWEGKITPITFNTEEIARALNKSGLKATVETVHLIMCKMCRFGYDRLVSEFAAWVVRTGDFKLEEMTAVELREWAPDKPPLYL